jgi:hypothetical protein
MGRFFLAVSGALFLALVVAGLTTAVAGQTAGNAKNATTRTWNAPRTPDGQPDLQGFWNYATLTPLERGGQAEGEAADEAAAEAVSRDAFERDNRDRRDGAGTDLDVARAYNEFWFGNRGKSVGRTSLIIDPPGGKIPALTDAAKKREADPATYNTGRTSRADSWLDRALLERCIGGGPSGPPFTTGGYNQNVEIVQATGNVVLRGEMVSYARVVPLDGRPHIGSEIRLWLGDARGRWEGNTLIVDTTNFSDKTSLRGSRSGLHLIERFTRADAETINYEYRVDDPTTFTKPWTVAFPLRKLPQVIYEYACHEGNYGMFGILSGARAQERSATDAAKKGSR